MYYAFMQSPLGPSVRVHREVIVFITSTKNLSKELEKFKKFIKYKLSSYRGEEIKDLMFLARIDSDIIDVIKESCDKLVVITIKI